MALAGRDSELTETTEQAEAIAALLSREPYSGVDYEVEVRHGALPQRARGRGWRLAAPVAILWHAERPLAVLAGGVLMHVRNAPRPLQDRLMLGAREAGLKVIQRREAELWSLMPSSRGAPSSEDS